MGCVANHVEARSQFVHEQVWSGKPVGAPPIVDCADLRRLPVWSEPAVSPTSAQLVQNRRRRAKPARLARAPGLVQRFMERPALVIRKIVTLVVHHEVDNRSLGQCCRLVQDEPPLLDSGSERAHAATLRVSHMPGKRSPRATKPPSSRFPCCAYATGVTGMNCIGPCVEDAPDHGSSGGRLQSPHQVMKDYWATHWVPAATVRSPFGRATAFRQAHRSPAESSARTAPRSTAPCR